MSKTNKVNPTWQCRICGDIRYETVKSERVINEAGEVSIIGRVHYCKGCGVLFRDPYLFNMPKELDILECLKQLP